MASVPRTFNFADVWEMAADAVPERVALVVGDQRRTYRQLEDRATRLANHLADRGVGPGDHVAVYLQNCAEYLETMLAAFKVRAVPVNVNYRYVADELRYLLADSDSVAVVTQPSLRVTVDGVVADLPRIRFTLVTGEAYEAALEAAPPERRRVVRSGDDHYVMYTGGTTGLPKGVVWRQEDAFYACIGGGDPMRLHGEVERPDELPERIVDRPVCYMPLAPMMHAAAQWTSLAQLFIGGKVVLLPGSLDPTAAWRAVEQEQVNILTVVGDAVARPLLDAWEAGDYDASSMYVFSNGGAPLSPSTRARILALFPNVMLTDGFGSSEAGTQGSSRTTAADLERPSRVHAFDQPIKPTIVVDTDGREVAPGSGVVGHVLAGGRLPLGYHRDPDKTAATFVERDGERWLITGDMATVAADGAIELIGRGAVAINTGGEKVFPEEVEGVLLGHPAVYDCVVIGVPDDRWGSAVTAVVRPVTGLEAAPTLEELATHCKGVLAGYKSPKRLVVVDQIVRSPSGKADYRWAKETAEKALRRN